MKTLLVLVLVFWAANAEYNKNQSPALSELLNDENLLQQFKKWQQSLKQSDDSILTRNYGGNPWLPPQTHPTAPPSRPPPYGEPQPSPGNPWYQPPVQPHPDPYPQPAPQPLPQPYPLPYPTATPPPTSYPPAVTGPPPTPEVEALRRYCSKPRGQFPARYCNKYVNCWDDTIIEQECPAGLLFSENGYCDYDFNVDCRGREISPGVFPQPTLPEGHKCPTLFGNYRSSKNCSEFFVCVHGSPVKFCCPSGLYYSTDLGVCDYPYNVNCFNPRPLHQEPQIQPYPLQQPNPYPQPNPGPYQPPYEQPQILPKPTTPAPQPSWGPYLQRLPADIVVNNQKSCVPNSIYRLQPDCSSVALCREGKTEVINCGHNTGFNADSGLCVARHLAKC